MTTLLQVSKLDKDVMFVTFLRRRSLSSSADAHILDIMTSLVSNQDQSTLQAASKLCFDCFLLSYRHRRLLMEFYSVTFCY